MPPLRVSCARLIFFGPCPPGLELIIHSLIFTDDLLKRPSPAGLDVQTTLRHFAIITYAVPPSRLRGLIDSRFELDCIEIEGEQYALLSVVPFEDQDFRSAVFPSPRWKFGQTNYRVYVRDRVTGRHAVWFLGTVLGSWTVNIPRYLWKLPWHYGRFLMDCIQDESGRYTTYRVVTHSAWAPAEIQLSHHPGLPLSFPGFPNLETGLVVLTHPLTGYYYRRDGRLGSYAIWHNRLAPAVGRVESARIDLLDRLGLVPFEEQMQPYSVLIQPQTEFFIRLPPRPIE